MADDEIVEGEGAESSDIQETVADEAVEESSAASAGPAVKPKPDLFSLLLIVTFLAFLAGTALSVNELHDFYDVGFWAFAKK